MVAEKELQEGRFIEAKIVLRPSKRLASDGTSFMTRNRFDEFDLVLTYEVADVEPQ